MKKIKIIFSILMVCSLLPLSLSHAADYSSSNFIVKDPVIDAGSPSGNSSSYNIGQSYSQSAIGKSSSGSYQLWSGFQYFFKANSNTVTATPGNGQVSLAWTVPQTFLGVSVGSYEVGVGTSSGSYTFTSVGSVTNQTVTGLSNGTTYYFRIKAKTPGNQFLVFSNETTAVPTGTTPPPSGGIGTQTPPNTASVNFSGLAYPGALVSVMLDGSVVATGIADSSGYFVINVSSVSFGQRSFVVYATDRDGQISSPTPMSVVVDQNGGKVSGILIAPTINVRPYQVRQGDQSAIFGYAAPGSKVTVSSDIFTQSTISETSGFWKMFINTKNYNLGKYIARAVVSKGNITSNQSRPAEFVIGKTTIEETPVTGRCGDFNQDGRINLIDFSILIFWFYKNQPPARVDCNQDNFIDLIDFSILMYNWTG